MTFDLPKIKGGQISSRAGKSAVQALISAVVACCSGLFVFRALSLEICANIWRKRRRIKDKLRLSSPGARRRNLLLRGFNFMRLLPRKRQRCAGLSVFPDESRRVQTDGGGDRKWGCWGQLTGSPLGRRASALRPMAPERCLFLRPPAGGALASLRAAPSPPCPPCLRSGDSSESDGLADNCD